jgi:hypothetical protein
LTLFCWLIPIGLLLSCSANDNILPTDNYQLNKSQRYDAADNDNGGGDGGLVNNYFRGKKQKFGLLSFLRNINRNYLPTVRTSKSY